MVFYCPDCKKLFASPASRCDTCGRSLSFDAVRPREIFLAEGYQDAADSAGRNGPPRRQADAPRDPWLARMSEPTAPPPGFDAEVPPADPAEPPRRRPGGSAAPSFEPADRGEIPPRHEGGDSHESPVPPPGFDASPGAGLYDDDAGPDVMPPPADPHYSAGWHDADPGERRGGSAGRSPVSRIILILLLLLLVGFLLHSVMTLRAMLSGTISRGAVILIAVVAVLLYLRRGR